jgi:hypothetical protein
VEGAQAATKLEWRRPRTETKLVRNIFPEQTKNLTAFSLFQRQRVVTASAPSTTVRSLRELQWSPSPAVAGAEGASDPVLAMRLHPSFAARTKATDVSPPNKMRGGGACCGAEFSARSCNVLARKFVFHGTHENPILAPSIVEARYQIKRTRHRQKQARVTERATSSTKWRSIVCGRLVKREPRNSVGWRVLAKP